MVLKLLITRKKNRSEKHFVNKRKTRRIKRYLSRKRNNSFRVKRLSVKHNTVKQRQYGGKSSQKNVSKSL